ADPAQPRIDRPAQAALDFKRMPVQARALVPVRHIRQPIRRLDAEYLEDFHGLPLARKSKAPGITQLLPPPSSTDAVSSPIRSGDRPNAQGATIVPVFRGLSN